MKQSPTIALTGGGTGGHITPLLSLAHALKAIDPNCRIIFIGLKSGILENNLRSKYQNFDEIYFIDAGKFRRYYGQNFLTRLIDFRTLLLNCRDFFRLLKGIAQARRLITKLNPDVVFSKGSFVSVPIGIAAHWKKIPIITHDSDALPGLANKIIGRWASVHATGMSDGLYNYPSGTIRYVGIPVDERIKPVNAKLQAAYKKQLGVPPSSKVLLVGGAGLGSLNINNIFFTTVQHLLSETPGLYIFHITGPAHEEEFHEKYRQRLSGAVAKRVTVLGFTPDFYKYTGAADLVVTRAGATTIAELAIARKAAVLIPAPFLTSGHQLKNAMILEKAGAAVVLGDDVPAENLREVLGSLLKDAQKRHELSARLAKLAKPAAAVDLAKLILEVSRSERAK